MTRTPPVIALLLALGAATFEPPPAAAWTEFLSMDVLPENSGWIPIFDGGGSSVVSGGILTLAASSYREYRAPASWINTVSIATGYTIEFRMRLVTSHPDCQGIGVWFFDNTWLTTLYVNPDHIWISYPFFGGNPPRAPVNGYDWHTYTIMVQGTHHRVFIDGAPALDYVHPGEGSGTRVLNFGDMAGSCTSSQSDWDYFAYDTAPQPVAAAPTTWGRLKTLYRAER
ncbi:MAG TPA: hypothetical protein VJY35_06280 [Candidatus Eisenbacteria bacterium]|nr:hypothetical protein [Candidatus Eisenbacteria bacterium]